MSNLSLCPNSHSSDSIWSIGRTLTHSFYTPMRQGGKKEAETKALCEVHYTSYLTVYFLYTSSSLKLLAIRSSFHGGENHASRTLNNLLQCQSLDEVILMLRALDLSTVLWLLPGALGAANEESYPRRLARVQSLSQDQCSRVCPSPSLDGQVHIQICSWSHCKGSEGMDTVQGSFARGFWELTLRSWREQPRTERKVLRKEKNHAHS